MPRAAIASALVPEPRLTIVPLSPEHDRAHFRCGEPALDAYLQRNATQDMRRRVAQVFVALASDRTRIDGYYTLSATSIEKAGLPPDLAKKLPHYPIPVVLLGRLAVATSAQGRGLGELLLMDALRRGLQASSAVAMYAVVVDAKHERAEAFYKSYGFQNLGNDSRRLFLPMAIVEKLEL